MKKILIIDDEVDICLLLEKFLSKKGYETASFNNGTAGIDWLKKNMADLVLCDFRLPDYNGVEILQKIKVLRPETEVIIITGYSDVRIAVDALKKGAYEYVTKPLYPDEILSVIESALEYQGSSGSPEKSENTRSSSKSRQNEKEYIVGTSQQAKLVQKHIELIAPTDMSVIIHGETGTGKEYVARAIHLGSPRQKKPFVAVDCGALPKDLAGSELFGHMKGAFTGAIQDKKGCFELASKGTLFLDEIGNLTYEHQVKLLRVLQEKVVKPLGGSKDIAIDVRVIVATNENLKEAVANGEFREDIYHRLNEFKIELSPLRERAEDVRTFANYFLGKANEQLGKQVLSFDDESMKILQSYVWHGNLRELRNVVKRAVLLTNNSTVNKSALPQEIKDVSTHFSGSSPIGKHKLGTLKSVVEEAERIAIKAMLERTANNKAETARLLDIDRKTLYNKLRIYNIDA